VSSTSAHHKTTRRNAYDTARAARPDCDEVILWTERGELTEATTSNLVLELDGERWTPPISAGLLAGTLRARLLAAGEIAERTLTPADLARAERVWLINSVRGWRAGASPVARAATPLPAPLAVAPGGLLLLHNLLLSSANCSRNSSSYVSSWRTARALKAFCCSTTCCTYQREATLFQAVRKRAMSGPKRGTSETNGRSTIVAAAASPVSAAPSSASCRARARSSSSAAASAAHASSAGFAAPRVADVGQGVARRQIGQSVPLGGVDGPARRLRRQRRPAVRRRWLLQQ
jgi:hypothetical protein